MFIDVSKHNGKINWDQVKAAGVEGAIIRCGYGDDVTSQDDLTFKYNIESALAVGLPVGVYFYTYATNTTHAESEVAHIKRLVEPYKKQLSLPVYIDSEESNTSNYAAACVQHIANSLEKSGYFVGVYASQSWWRDNLSGVDRYSKWVARYSDKEPVGVDNVEMWQYSSTGNINGIIGNVDCNKLFRSDLMTVVRNFYAGKKTTTSSTAAAKKTYTVVKGDTMTAIAKAHGTTLKTLKSLNPQIKDANKIVIGQVINLE